MTTGRNSRRPIAGVELGGTKCICLLASSPDEVIDEVRIETGDPEATLSAIEAVLERWAAGPGFAALGIASFGPLQLDGRTAAYGSIVSTPKPGWSGAPVFDRLARFDVPTAIDTDVVGAARAEQRWGAAQGLTDFAYITVGTGIGVGAIVADHPIRARGNAEIGHMRVPRLGGDDWPGVCRYHGDCVEGLASGTAIAARHGPGNIGDDWDGWASVEHGLAMLVHNLLVAFQPQRIIIGGGVACGRPALVAAVMKRASKSLAGFYTAADLPGGFLVAPGLGERSGPLGALALGLGALTSGRD